MGFWSKIFKKRKEPEEYYTVTITDSFVRVEHPKRETEQVTWKNIELIKLINTDAGPFLPDVWLVLLGKEDGCMIPQGAEGFMEVYDKISQYEGFSNENFIKSMQCTSNAEFILWVKKKVS